MPSDASLTQGRFAARATCQALARLAKPYSQVHNAGLLDEYKEIWIEQGPTGDELLSQK